MSADKSILEIPDEVIESLARTILPSIRQYFQSEEGLREFEEWRKKKNTNNYEIKRDDLFGC